MTFIPLRMSAPPGTAAVGATQNLPDWSGQWEIVGVTPDASGGFVQSLAYVLKTLEWSPPNKPELQAKIDKIVAMTQKAHPRDCVWIGPPKWRVNGKPVMEMIKAHVAPCVLFDSTDIEMQRKPDKVHPDEKGGDQWAVAFWHWFRGPDADAGTFDIYNDVLR